MRNLSQTELQLCSVLENNLQKTGICLLNYQQHLRKAVREAKQILKKAPEPENKKRLYKEIFSEIAQTALWDTFEEMFRDKNRWNNLFNDLWNEEKILEIDNTVDNTTQPQGGKIDT